MNDAKKAIILNKNSPIMICSSLTFLIRSTFHGVVLGCDVSHCDSWWGTMPMLFIWCKPDMSFSRISSTRPPSFCTHPTHEIPISVRPRGSVFHAVRAPGPITSAVISLSCAEKSLNFEKGFTTAEPCRQSAALESVSTDLFGKPIVVYFVDFIFNIFKKWFPHHCICDITRMSFFPLGRWSMNSYLNSLQLSWWCSIGISQCTGCLGLLQKYSMPWCQASSLFFSNVIRLLFSCRNLNDADLH